jgi:hypothetical protein
MWHPANHHIDFGREQGQCKASCIIGGIYTHSVIIDGISWGKASCLRTFVRVSGFFISVNKM